MRACLVVGAVLLVAVGAAAQETPAYKVSDNPFQDDLPFAVGQPVQLLVEVAGVRFRAFTLSPRGEVKEGASVSCDLQLDGSNQGERKVEVSGVLLLEDEQGKGIERIPLEPFKVKAGRDFAETLRVTAQGATLLAARRVYVFLELK